MTQRGERTRRRIVERSAPVFNTRGYFGTTMSDLVLASGLEKGGIYNHFGSKEELALEAFDYAAGLVLDRLRRAVGEREGAVGRLLAVPEVYRELAENPPVRGGCPILNTAVEADDAHAALRERVRRAVEEWRGIVAGAAREGVESGELARGVDPEELATVIVSTLEGAVMLCRLYRDPEHMRRATNHLESYVRSLATGGSG